MNRLLQINIESDENGEKFIDVLYSGYNIIQETIYNNELAETVLQLINKNRQTDPNDTI